jgi:hypothetical protein
VKQRRDRFGIRRICFRKCSTNDTAVDVGRIVSNEMMPNMATKPNEHVLGRETVPDIVARVPYARCTNWTFCHAMGTLRVAPGDLLRFVLRCVSRTVEQEVRRTYVLRRGIGFMQGRASPGAHPRGANEASLLAAAKKVSADPSRPLFIFVRRCSRATDLRCHTMCRLELVAGCPRLPLHPDPRPNVDL